ncbi:hypothetical protein NDN08_008089 [Rhodosorus marinus]|uniref:Rubredoxin-like domain-containing protein n=1 Tax=Rhodosorus marinus TaxID=101924 RepID=A0AAV8V3E1_9RHOD|nr:hypothetical protein NDN08_008089 [Rhodosorus marinus]
MGFVSGVSANSLRSGRGLGTVGRYPNRLLFVSRGVNSRGRRSVVKMSEEEFWQGEWVCVDCGYIYGQSEGVPFEELPTNFRCPQCRAPKRRFAKKAGEVVASNADASNTQILLVSLLGLFAIVAFGIWAAQEL